MRQELAKAVVYGCAISNIAIFGAMSFLVVNEGGYWALLLLLLVGNSPSLCYEILSEKVYKGENNDSKSK